jgi:uncharacterized protein involved in outer membrane biogenesis
MNTSRLRWWLIRLTVVGLILAGIAVASSLAVRAYAPTLSRDRLEHALAELLGRPVRIERVALSLWLGRAIVQNLRVDAGPGEGTEPVVRLGRGELHVGISSLWRRQLVLSTILLQDLEVRLSGPDRDAAPPSLDFPDTFVIGPVTVRIQTIQVERSRVVYRDASRKLLVDVQGLRLRARPERRGIALDLRLDTLALQASDVRETIADVQAAGWIHQDLLSISTAGGRW